MNKLNSFLLLSVIEIADTTLANITEFAQGKPLTNEVIYHPPIPVT